MVGFGLIKVEFEIAQDDSQQKPRAQFAIDQAGILALPAQTRSGRKDPLKHGSGVDIATVVDGLARQGLQSVAKGPHTVEQNLVIVRPTRIARHGCASPAAEVPSDPAPVGAG